MTVVSTEAGTWRGTQGDKGRVTVFRGIRYAQAERFGVPRRPTPHTDEPVDATEPGRIAPQTPSRLEGVMGAAGTLPQSEDCLRLTVTTPGITSDTGPEPSGPRPVMVWLHGGAYLSGSGEWDVYDARRLSAEGGIIVVSVGYRLGALGYLRAPGVSGGNLGLLDQISALEWVQDNIHAFGGDPRRVTVVGQSAGAHSIAAILGAAGSARLFHRAVLQSAPLGLGFATQREAERVGELFLQQLGTDPFRATVAEILAAQGRAARLSAGRLGLNSAPPFLPVADAGPLPDPETWRTSVLDRARGGLDIVLGTTRDEMKAFFGHHPVFHKVRSVPLAGGPVADGAERLIRRKVFDAPTRSLADLLAGAGARVYRYQVHRFPVGGPFGACHCIELPLLFGQAEDGDDGVGAAWRGAPMLSGVPPRTLASAGTRMRALWSEFVRSGMPDGSRWRRHTPGSRYAAELP
ncbi:carboxylesterase family protein [Streptomyces sp. NPDC032161]|uniref:carboxylesterase family protein n=1 Tax=unclassified Streptomyces TaxID=2593676 RepID=UPI0033FDC838